MSPDENAKSHAGQHGDFQILWNDGNGELPESFEIGWYWIYVLMENPHVVGAVSVGPFETSQSAFGNFVDNVDSNNGNIFEPVYVFGERRKGRR